MKSVRVLAVLTLAAAAAGGAAGCGTMNTVRSWFLRGDVISYDQYLSIDAHAEPKPSVDDVINALGRPSSYQDKNGARVRLDYHAYGLDDTLRRAEFRFDKNERLIDKSLW